jgi:hypothetical protein
MLSPVLSPNLARPDNVSEGYGSIIRAHACPGAFGFGGGSTRQGRFTGRSG